MRGRLITALVGIPVLFASACGTDMTHDRVIQEAKDRGFVVIEGSEERTGARFSIGVNVGTCDGTFYMYPEGDSHLAVYDEYGGVIKNITEPKLNAVLKTPPTSICQPEE